MLLLRVFLVLLLFVVPQAFGFSRDARVNNVSQIEYDTLIDFYFQLNGNYWYNRANWTLPYVSPCQWYGVVCDPSGRHVSALKLSNNNLNGNLPTDIAGLFTLDALILGGNPFLTGPIPDQISELKGLSLFNLSSTKISGAIPDSIGVLMQYSLQQFNVAYTNLGGPLPLWISQAPMYGVSVDLTGDVFFCPIPYEAYAMGATCISLDVVAIQPPCPQPNALVLVFGSDPWPTGSLTCSWSLLDYFTYNNNQYYQSPATMVNEKVLACGWWPDALYYRNPTLMITEGRSNITPSGYTLPYNCQRVSNTTNSKKKKKVKLSNSAGLLDHQFLGVFAGLLILLNFLFE